MSSTPVLAPVARVLAPVIAPARRPGSFRRAVAMLVLPASIVPVIFMGPTLLRSPQHLVRQAQAEVQRLEGGTSRRALMPPILPPVPGPQESPAIRRGGTATLPALRPSR